MNGAKILERLQDIFRSELDDDALVLRADAQQHDIAAWDSLAHVRIIAAVEREFDFQLDLSEIESIASVPDLISAVQKHVG